jgi:short-subunit dehydrogenase
MPVWSAYCSSKHALESFSDCLHYELQQFGVPVVLVKPGPVATPIWQKARNKSTVEVDQQRFAAAMEVYGDIIEGVSGIAGHLLRCCQHVPCCFVMKS